MVCRDCHKDDYLDSGKDACMCHKIRNSRFAVMKQVVKQRCKYQDEYPLSKFECLFYTFKCLICLFLNLNRSLYLKDCVEVAYWNFRDRSGIDGYTWDITLIKVPYGFFNWCYDITDDGD